MTDQRLPVQEIAALLWRRRALMSAVFLCGLLAAIVLAWMQTPVYRASAKLMLTSARATIAVSPDANERPRVDPVTEADVGSEVALLSSMSLLREVLAPHQQEIETPEPAGIRAWIAAGLRAPTRLYRAIHGVAPASRLDEWAEDTARDLSVGGIGRSNLIEVAYDSPDPAWASRLVNELVSHHVGRHVRMNQQASAQQFFESQRELLADKLSAAEADLREFYRREGIEATGTALPTLRTRVAKLEAALADAETELAEATAEGGFLGRALQTMPRDGGAAAPGLAGAPTSGTALIKARLVELELQRSQVLSQFAPTSMKVGDIDRQIAEAKRLLEQEKRSGGAESPTRLALETNLTQTRARAAALEARVGALRSQLDANRTNLGRLGGVASEQERLEQEVSAAKQSLTTYLKKEEEARFSNALDESRFVNVSVVEPATTPETPQPSKQLLTILLGALVSLGAAVGLAFLRDRLDPSLKSGAEAERLSGLPVLAEIPT